MASVRKLRESGNGNLVVFDSSQLLQALAKNDLIDEYTLLLYPVILGSGKRLFANDDHRRNFILSDSLISLISPTGVAILTYQRSADS